SPGSSGDAGLQAPPSSVAARFQRADDGHVGNVPTQPSANGQPASPINLTALPASLAAPAPVAGTSSLQAAPQVLSPATPAAATPAAVTAPDSLPVAQSLPVLPLGFEHNVGQVADVQQQFVAHGPHSAFYVASNSATLVLQPSADTPDATATPGQPD